MFLLRNFCCFFLFLCGRNAEEIRNFCMQRICDVAKNLKRLQCKNKTIGKLFHGFSTPIGLIVMILRASIASKENRKVTLSISSTPTPIHEQHNES